MSGASLASSTSPVPCPGAYIEDDLKKPPEVTTPRLEQKQQLDMRMPQVQGF